MVFKHKAMNLTINYTSLERYSILYRANEDTFRKLIPTISFYSVLAILGVAGNILSIYIFVTQMLKNQQNELFILLCVFNLLACGVCIPLDIFEMRNMYLYPSTMLCKIARFLNMFTMVSSTLTLSSLALFRLRAASSGGVVSMKRSKRIAGLGFLVLLSASLSWIAAVVFGIRSSPTYIGNITGRDCSIADDSNNTAWPPVFNVVLVIGFTSQLAVIAAAYYRIWRIVRTSRVAVTAYTAQVCPHNNGERKTDLFRYKDNVTVLPVEINENKTDSNPQEVKNVNLYLVDINEGKADLSFYEDSVNVSDEEINERETDMSTHEENVNVFPDEISETKTDLYVHQYKMGTNTVCTAHNNHNQSNKSNTVLIVADDSVCTALVNDASTDGRSTDNLTLMENSRPRNEDSIAKNELLNTVGIVKNALINADNKTNDTLPNTDNQARHAPTNTDNQTRHAPTNTDNQARHAPTNTDNQTRHAPTNTDNQARHAPTNTDNQTRHAPTNTDNQTRHAPTNTDNQTRHAPTNTDNQTRHAPTNTDNQARHAQTNTDGTVKDTPLNTGGILRNWSLIASGIATINADNCSRFVTDSNVHPTTTLGGITSSVVHSPINGNNENPHIVQTSKSELKHRENPELSITRHICRKTCNSNSSPILHNETLTSRSQKTNTEKHYNQHSTALNIITKDVVCLDLKTTPSTQEKIADKPDEIKQKLTKSSLEAAVTRNAFLLTLTFVVSYLPFFFVSIPRAIDRDFDYSKDAVMTNLVNIVIRLYFVMPVVSPAIFWASNLDFRRRCKALCSKNNTVVV